ncbi:MAG: cell division protein FtsX [Bacteroides sp.]
MNNKKREHRSTGSGMQNLTAGVSILMVLLVLGLVVFFGLTARNLSVYVRENIGFSILLSDEMREGDIVKMQRQLDQEPYVRQSEYISKKQALKEQTEAMGTDPAEFLGYNPFKPSIEVKLNNRYANSDSIALIVKTLKKNKYVQEVTYPKDLMDAVNKNIRGISLFLLALAAVLTFISFALINNIIRLTVYSKRFLIHTMKLTGASWSFIRRPFVRRSVAMGVVSAVLADAMLWLGAQQLLQWEPELSAVVTAEVMLQVSLAVLLSGVMLTWLCALFSVGRYLRMKACEMYYI